MGNLKTYVCKGKFLNRHMKVVLRDNDGKIIRDENGTPRKHSIDFMGGEMLPNINKDSDKQKKRYGTFVTANKNVQDALENHPGYGKSFMLRPGQEKNPALPNFESLKVEKPLDAVEEIEIPKSEEDVKNLQDEEGNDTYLEDAAKQFKEIIREKVPEEEEMRVTQGTEVPGVTNQQGARNYLAKEFEGEVLLSKLNNNKAILEFAEKKNIVFPDWTPKS